MTFAELKEKALSLPLAPGVYIMQDRNGQVIYVGKAKKLKNRVSQYFQASAAHTGKTRRMVSQIDSFDTIVASSEFEALVLECSLIKRHMPRYNILLKDDKGYPFVRVDVKKDFPTMEMVGKVQEDGAKYFGPFGGRYITQQLLDAIRVALKLPNCSHNFEKGSKQGRVCLNFHIGNCDGWCKMENAQAAYRERMEQAMSLLKGDYKKLAAELRRKMEQAAEELRFEEAASLRDRAAAIEKLSQKQLVTAGASSQTDVIGYFENESRACFAVLHFADGALLDKEYEFLTPAQQVSEAVASLVKQYYLRSGMAPKEILLPTEMEDGDLFAELLSQTYGKKVRIRTPQRGDGVRLVQLALENAKEEVERVTSKEEKHQATLRALGELMGLLEIPKRLESYDISNTAGTDIVASMVVFEEGRPKKKDYRHFRIRDLEDQDDYASMRQVIRRRFKRYLENDPKFSVLPDALLIDGGAAHVTCAEEELEALGVSVPVFGMVKDDRHRTRGLVTAQNEELGLTGNPALFALIGKIQEETHRFAITYHRKEQSKHIRTSQLENIPGIGKSRSSLLLKTFKSVKAIREADVEMLKKVVPENVANAIYTYFHREGEA